jgi:nitrite reductase/ring-hydroxylating ferredoxin subunit/uncharacterized membrane protein
MKSYASINGHPIHPMLIVYPFALLTGAFGCRVAEATSGNRELKTVSDYLVRAGIGAGLLAAVPGSLDYFRSVPPESSGRDRATKHALLNVTGLGLFAAGWLLGRGNGNLRRAWPLFFEGMGTAVMCVAGYLGGTLVYRNQIGVDHRYADAGKWQEASIDDSRGQALVSAAHGLGVNQMKLVHADGRRVAVARTEEGYVAFQDRCTHKGGPLSDGALMCGRVQCPWHGSQFDVKTGEVKCGPAAKDIAVYASSDAHAVKRGA